MKPLITHGMFFGQLVSFVCDRKCNKAWGNNCRRRIFLNRGRSSGQVLEGADLLVGRDEDNEDNWEMFADHELGEAPEKSLITECDQNKPTLPVTIHNKWCVRECERCHTYDRGKTLYIYTFEMESKLFTQPDGTPLPSQARLICLACGLPYSTIFTDTAKTD